MVELFPSSSSSSVEETLVVHVLGSQYDYEITAGGMASKKSVVPLQSAEQAD